MLAADGGALGGLRDGAGWVAGKSSAVGGGEGELVIGVTGDRPPAFVRGVVVAVAEQAAVCGRRLTAVGPMGDVVAFGPTGRRGTGGMSASLVAQDERFADGAGEGPLLSTDIDDF